MKVKNNKFNNNNNNEVKIFYKNYLSKINTKIDNTYLYKIIKIFYKLNKYFYINSNKQFNLYFDYFYKYNFINNLVYSLYQDKKNYSFIDNKFKINKYISTTNNFLDSYTIFYNMNIKSFKNNNIIEISSNPVFFEVFNYFQLYFNLYNKTNYSVYYSDLNYSHFPKNEWLNKIDNYKNKFENINFKYSPIFTNLDNNYDFMILNLFQYKHRFNDFILSDVYNNIFNIKYQLYYLNFLNNNGSCLFYIYSLQIDETKKIFIHLSKIFEKITIFGRNELSLLKYLGGVWLYCQNKGSYQINEKNIINKIKKWNYNEDKKKYKYLLKYYNFLSNIKKINLTKIRNEQLKSSYEWAKKYNFAILPIYDPILPDSFYKSFDEYFKINQSFVNCKINLLSSNESHLKDTQNFNQKFYFQINILTRLECIYQSLLESILSTKSYLFSPFSLNPSNLVYYIEQNYKIPFINNSWLQYFELFSSSPCLFKNKNLISLHLNELPGFSISSLFYYLQIFHKNINWDWKSICTSKCVKKDIFGYYKKYKNHFLPKIQNKSKFNYINIEINNKDTDYNYIFKTIKTNLVLKGTCILHFNFEKIEDLNNSFYENILEFSSYFKNIQLFRSQWALTKNSFFIIGIQKLKSKNKSKKINIDNFKNHIQQCLFNIFNQYQFEIEKYYFIYQNEKNFKNKNIKLIENNMIQRNKKWCDKMKLNKINLYF